MSFVKLNKSTGGKIDVNPDQVRSFSQNLNPQGEKAGTDIVFTDSNSVTVSESADAVRSQFRKAQQPLKPVAAEPETKTGSEA